jgi:hypothetical protein
MKLELGGIFLVDVLCSNGFLLCMCAIFYEISENVVAENHEMGLLKLCRKKKSE